MYTQCPKCETVFKMSAAVLRAAGGQVRCGQCGEVFSALARLAEDPNTFTSGESPLEMEARADRILESIATAPPAARTEPEEDTGDLEQADVEFARLQVIDMPPESLEFSLPPTELDRVFVEPKTAAKSPTRANGAQDPGRPRTPGRPAVPGDESTGKAASGRSPPPTPPPATAHARLPQHPESPAAFVPDRTSFGGLVPEDVRREMLAGMEQKPLPSIAPARRRSLPLLVWPLAALVLSGTLAAQMMAVNRTWVAKTFGVGSSAQPNLSAYQQQVWGVTGDPSASGTLRVRASILNTSAQLQPYPLLRITLTDRFGTRIGSRDFEPSEYLGKPMVRMLAPGERADATLDIQDPGKDAEGYELDVCLRGAEQRVVCAADAAAQSKS